MAKIRIVSLDDIITQDRMNTARALLMLIMQKNPHFDQRILANLSKEQSYTPEISKFNSGQMTEKEFNHEMIAKMAQITGVLLSKEEFNKAWGAMNPRFEEYSALLREVVKENHAKQKIILVSDTNPKEIRQLRAELDKNNFPYTVDENDDLLSIGGLALNLSYKKKKSRTDLILQVIEQLGNFSKLSNFFGNESRDIKYVLNIQKMEESLTDQNELSLSEVLRLSKKRVDTLFWNKGGQSFAEVINSTNMNQISVMEL